MVKVIHVDDSGAEMAVVEIDDFTVEVVYAGIAAMLRHAAAHPEQAASVSGLSPQARRRREKVLTRIKD